ncbi:MAG: hypothetical protein Q7J80_10360 [Anaerolineales bacterium]|nr:hypothetical protein [Anaerolineales bacterium]
MILALIAIVVIAALSLLGSNVNTMFGTINASI